ncbi:Uncharacterised protein [Vibrio cholerae]|nr:hypothetical protein DN30_3681 [Vibrio cholerae]CSB83149.1 Uncharacterised protein [Vibrio cholerae]
MVSELSCASRMNASQRTCLWLLTKFAIPLRLNSSWLKSTIPIHGPVSTNNASALRKSAT